MFCSADGARCIVLKFFYITFLFVIFNTFSFGRSLVGIYLTHKGTPGGQSVVEVFEYKNKYYLYNVKNLEFDNPVFNCSNDSSQSKSIVGTVFGYGYVENAKGEFVNGIIYNLYNCKKYYGKIITKNNGNIEFIGSLDSNYWLSMGYEWQRLLPSQAIEYNSYRQPIDKLIESIEQSDIVK